MGGFFSCGNNTCIANRQGLCIDIFHMSPEFCEMYTVPKPQISNENKDLLESSTVNKPTRTELTVNELIALELVRVWCSQSCGMPAKFSMVFDRYIEARNRLNEEGSGE